MRWWLGFAFAGVAAVTAGVVVAVGLDMTGATCSGALVVFTINWRLAAM